MVGFLHNSVLIHKMVEIEKLLGEINYNWQKGVEVLSEINYNL